MLWSCAYLDRERQDLVSWPKTGLTKRPTRARLSVVAQVVPVGSGMTRSRNRSEGGDIIGFRPLQPVPLSNVLADMSAGTKSPGERG